MVEEPAVVVVSAMARARTAERAKMVNFMLNSDLKKLFDQ
jgi:hypothetical protein